VASPVFGPDQFRGYDVASREMQQCHSLHGHKPLQLLEMHRLCIRQDLVENPSAEELGKDGDIQEMGIAECTISDQG
jgi:hypothetical protein